MPIIDIINIEILNISTSRVTSQTASGAAAAWSHERSWCSARRRPIVDPVYRHFGPARQQLRSVHDSAWPADKTVSALHQVDTVVAVNARLQKEGSSGRVR